MPVAFEKLDKSYADNMTNIVRQTYGIDVKVSSISKVNFSEYEIPRRIFRYYGDYIAEIIDNGTNRPVWAVLSKWKGVWHFPAYFDSLQTLEQSL